MALSVDKMKRYTQRLLMSRLRILNKHPFFGLLLMHMKFSVDEQQETACTDGERIVFGTTFLDELNEEELDFIMMHEILHVALQHWCRVEKFEHERFNEACDIVVNSIILQENGMRPESITLRKFGESMHLAPNGREGHEYSVEEIYHMLFARPQSSWDNHSQWGKNSKNHLLKDTWQKHFEDACEAISIREASNGCGSLPLFAKRMLQKLRNPQMDWRTILNAFVQEEIVDYSFIPPDRRFMDCPFFLPDFNEKDDRVENILFMIDTSGSMSDDMITAAYSEVKGAIDQFDDKLKGWLGFFDAEVVEPKPFENEEEFKIIYPVGGGGTSFYVIFRYIKEKMMDKLPASVIILTDGYAKFPKQDVTMDIPVLWLINNEDITPPWGKIARIIIE